MPACAEQSRNRTAGHPAGGRELGRARKRKEDAKLITGQTTWTDNIQMPGMAHMAFLRSPMAHARIVSIDVSPALQRPGVFAAFTAADLGVDGMALPCAWPVTPDMVHPDHHPLATDEVRHLGDAGRGRRRAGPLLGRRRARGHRGRVRPAARRHRHGGGARRGRRPRPRRQGHEQVLHVALRQRRRRRRRSTVRPTSSSGATSSSGCSRRAMEPRAVVVAPIAAADEYTVYSATQIPHILRLMLAMTTGIPEQKIRVIAPDVGGGFGSKLNVYAEEVAALMVAKKLGRPVKWTESRSENYQATIHGRDQIQRLAAAFDADGRMRGLKVDLLADMGAYLQLVTPGIPILGAFMYNSIYKMDALHFEATGVFTTKTPTDAYRGAGRPEATFAIERLMDDAAHELGMEPLELREKNWIKHEEFPYDDHRRSHLRQRQLRGGHRQGQGAVRLRRSAGRAAAPPRRRRTRCSSASASRPSRRCAASRPRGCSARCPTAPAGGRRPRSACCPPARSRWSPAPARTGRATSPRGARSSPTRSACRSRTSRCCTATPSPRPRASTPTGRGRWSSAASRCTRPARR